MLNFFNNEKENDNKNSFKLQNCNIKKICTLLVQNFNNEKIHLKI